MTPPRAAAVIPAAGKSARMGRPKLVLPVKGGSLIGRVVLALREGGADPVVVVSPPAFVGHAKALSEEARRAGARIISPDREPPDMRASVEIGLRSIEESGPPDVVLVSPGDCAGLSAEVVRRVIDAHEPARPQILVPAFQGRRGHPLLLPWAFARQVFELPAGVGLNHLLKNHPEHVAEVGVDDGGVLGDVDTPDDYARWSPGV